ncbi:MAG: hypothetical protein DI537_22030 [Stutzerimonas stutzeri]|nr:MAG: hypothetical protein DI537_22030 [Stutzerimonas stutzeri]
MRDPPAYGLLGGAFAALIIVAAGWAVGQGAQPGRAQAPSAELPSGLGEVTLHAPAGYVGSRACASCHATTLADWQGSDHAKAMAVATPESVLGDFSNVAVAHDGESARFRREGGRFLVETQGKDGQPETFAISHSFGWRPLQQYLVTFPDGRLQALPWAWDARPQAQGGQRWFHVYGDQAIPAGDQLHWAGRMQNWNFMCAECHSTALKKGYDAASNSFRTTYSEVSIGCESCHGPGAGHVAWAAADRTGDKVLKGFAAVAAKRPPVDWTPDPATGSPATGAPRPPGDEVEMCARCHQRRGTISEDWKPGHSIVDTHLPALLTSGLFAADGQMIDEVFTDQTFRQSKMYAKGVICSDCHDVHSGRLKAQGPLVCSQCHDQQRFAAATHTGHQPGPGAPDCITCHMPARTYMVVDRRHDHSFRIPRPDLTASLGTPNSCNSCHSDKTAQWAADAVVAWHGPQRKGFQDYARTFHDARRGDPAARAPLIALANNPQIPAIVRATAQSELGRLPAIATEGVTRLGLDDPDPIVRIAALRNLSPQPPDIRLRWAQERLTDPVLGVRIEAAQALADIRPDALQEPLRSHLRRAFVEFEAAQALNSDRPEARASLALYLIRRGRPDAAEAELRAGLALDPAAVELSVNLADLLRQRGRDPEAEAVLRQAIAVAPKEPYPHHALGLALVRQRRYPEALESLTLASRLAPRDAQLAYVHGVALQSLGQPEQGRQVLRSALQANPFDAALLGALLADAQARRDHAGAADLADRLSRLRPDDAELARLAARLARP